MDKTNIKKIAIIFSVSALVIIIGGIGIYHYGKVQKYNNLITTANKYMDSGEYDKAISLFQQSLQYKKDLNVDRNIKLAKSLKEVKSIYDEGINLMNNKKYLEAIEQFKKISKEDEKMYSDSQNKIEECKKQYIALNMQNANEAAKNNKYDDASKYLDEVLKLDSNNADAKSMKDTFAKAVNAQQEEHKSETTSSHNDVTREQAATILNNMNLTGMEIKGEGQLTPTEFVVNEENIYGHNCYYIGGIGGNGILFVLDSNTGKLYESQGRGKDGRRLLELKR